MTTTTTTDQTTKRPAFRALHNLAIGKIDAHGVVARLDLAPGDTFDALPSEMGGLREGVDYARADAPKTETEWLRERALARRLTGGGDDD